jgi:serine/threonine protein kinase
MPLSPGTKLGPYEILAPIGAGGMGEVYQAHDGRLERTVAIKIPPASMATDPERRRRFEQEARSVAALSHPNIVAIYDVGIQDDTAFLVQELIDGESLRALIDRGALTMRKALGLAGQIADALSAAHHAGVIHRDLKPENIMVTAQGRAKILDFGLARQSDTLLGDTDGRTKTIAVTKDGVLLGTVGYMSPEQARGITADARSDIFSFGAVFYEMLTAKRAFQRQSAADTLAAILKEDPPELPDTVSAGVRQVILHCLEKDPGQRFQSAQDLSFAIYALSGSSVSVAVEAAPHAPSRRGQWPFAVAAAAAIAAGIFAAARLAAVPAVDLTRQRHTILVSEAPALRVPRWAPDGKSFTYTSSSQLLIQTLDAPLPSAVEPIRFGDAVTPFFSPDGSRIWYTSLLDNRSVWSVGSAGGEPRKELGNLGGFVVMDGVEMARDGKSLVVTVLNEGVTTLRISSPPGSPLRPFPGAPSLNATFSRVRLRFTHDGRKLLASLADPDSRRNAGFG